MTNQRGVTLISLMIGLVISMIAVLGVTTLFRTVLKNNTDASIRAQITAERASALLIADMHLQDAGYAATGAADDNILLMTSAKLSDEGVLSGTSKKPDTWAKKESDTTPATEGNALVWRFNNSAEPGTNDHRCAGLWLDSNSIYFLSSTDVCSSVNSALSNKWDKQLLVNIPSVDGEDYSTTTVFKVFQAQCSGFGIAGEGGLQVTLQTEHSLGSDFLPIQLGSTTCLLNFPYSPPESI